MHPRIGAVGFVVLLFAAGCASSLETPERQDGELLFSRDVLPTLQQDFLPLLEADAGLSLESWSTLIRGSDRGEVVIPYDADRSLLIELAERAGAAGPSEENLARVRRWIDEGARNDAGDVPYADADQLLYVCNQGSAVISIIDMEANVVIRTIDLQDLGFSGNAKPHHAAVAPDGSYWYVSLIGENAVLKFNRDNELIDRISFDVPGMLAVNPTEEALYVGRSMSAVNPPPRIGVVEPNQSDVEELDVFYPRPHALAVDPTGRFVYSASLAVNQLAAVNVAGPDVDIHDIPGPHHSLVQFAVAPDGQTVIAGGEMSGQLLFFDLADPLSPTVSRAIDLGGAPWHPVITPAGAYAYVPRKNADAVSVVGMASRSEEAVITGEGLAEPHGSAIRSDGRYVYVSNNNLRGGYTPRYNLGGDPPGTVVVIDTATREIVKVLEVENYPTGIGTRPFR